MSLPLDIPYDTLPEWLATRSITSSRWLRDLKRVRAKITAATPSLLSLSTSTTTTTTTNEPNEQLAAALSPLLDQCSLPTLSDPTGRTTFQDHCSYNDAKKILQLLLHHLDPTKSFLGYYKQPTLAEWDDIVRSYESSSLYLAEAARSMVQDCKYEVGALRKSSDTNDQRMIAIQRRLKDLQRLERDVDKEYSKECRRLKISGGGEEEKEKEKEMVVSSGSGSGSAMLRGDEVRAALSSRVSSELDAKLQDIHRSFQENKTLLGVMNYYDVFRRALHGGGGSSVEAASDASRSCPTLRSLLSREINEIGGQAAAEEEEIDWSAMLEAGTEGEEEGGAQPTAAAAAAAAAAEEEEIDWSAMLEAGVDDDGSGGGESSSAAAVEIVWDIEETDSAAAVEMSTTTTSPPLASATERGDVLSELECLQYFLLQRKHETEEDSNSGNDLLRTIARETKVEELLSGTLCC